MVFPKKEKKKRKAFYWVNGTIRMVTSLKYRTENKQ